MKKIVITLFLIIILAATGCIAYFSIYQIKPGTVGLVEDLRKDEITDLFSDKVNFVWQGAAPWWFSVYTRPAKQSTVVRVQIPIPPLESLKGELYTIKASVSIVYEIVPDKYFDYNKLRNNSEELNAVIVKYVQAVFMDELDQYISTNYRRATVLYNSKNIEQNIKNNCEEKFSTIGLRLVNFDILGSIVFPDDMTYQDGLRHLSDIRKIEKKYEIDLLSLNKKLEQSRIANKETYDKLSNLSKIIKENPDILKYIYIDKMASNVKMIISSPGNATLPFDLGNSEKAPVVKDNKGKEIDNLR